MSKLCLMSTIQLADKWIAESLLYNVTLHSVSTTRTMSSGQKECNGSQLAGQKMAMLLLCILT